MAQISVNAGSAPGAGDGDALRTLALAFNSNSTELYALAAQVAADVVTEAAARVAADGLKANLASPALTGTPTAPTAALGTDTTQIATMAAVKAARDDAIDAVTNGAGAALDTLAELSAALGDDANYAATVTAALATKAPLASPSLTGTPLVPTALFGTNTTQVASTAFVQAALAGFGSVPTGFVGHFNGSSAPDGWLKRNGAAVSRVTYSALFAVIGTTYGSGDGSTTFNLPDDRANFDRGLDDGRGVDTSRALGSEQLDAFQGHQHNAAYQGGGSYGISSASIAAFSANSGNTGGPVSDGTNGTPRTAAETRPRNRAYLAIIKY